LAFHFEPMLALLAPIYVLGGDARHLLVLQSAFFALGAIPAYLLGARWSGSPWAGAAVAGAYLLSPLGQWAMLADFHTTALAAPLLLLAIERLAARHSIQGVAVACLAFTARADAAVAVIAVGLFALVRGRWRGLAAWPPRPAAGAATAARRRCGGGCSSRGGRRRSLLGGRRSPRRELRALDDHRPCAARRVNGRPHSSRRRGERFVHACPSCKPPTEYLSLSRG